jgi:hypothetical protein
MPHIIVVADSRQDPKDGAVMLRERISSSDLESRHFAAHLLERLEWAVEDAHEAEQTTDPPIAQQSRLPDQRSARVLTTAS